MTEEPKHTHEPASRVCFHPFPIPLAVLRDPTHCHHTAHSHQLTRLHLTITLNAPTNVRTVGPRHPYCRTAVTRRLIDNTRHVTCRKQAMRSKHKHTIRVAASFVTLKLFHTQTPNTDQRTKQHGERSILHNSALHLCWCGWVGMNG
jgi:hypothetical protein